MASESAARDRAESAILAVVIVLATIGLTLLPLTSAPYVRAMVSAVGAAERTGLGEEATFTTAEHVRRFVTDSSAPSLPASIEGRAAYDEASVSHLVDVRDVLVPARIAGIAFAVLASAWVAIRWRAGRGRALLARTLSGAGWALLAGVACVAALGMADFDVLFARFHGVFFAPGTWQFPDDALLIRVFPLQFWTASGATWGVLVAGVALSMLCAARRIRFTAGNMGV